MRTSLTLFIAMAFSYLALAAPHASNKSIDPKEAPLPVGETYAIDQVSGTKNAKKAANPNTGPYKCSVEENPGLVTEVSQSLEWFINHLKSYMDGLRFKQHSFLAVNEKLGKQLSEITDWAAQFPHNQDLEDSLRFAANIYGTMSIASKYLEYFESKRTSHRILCSVIQLNIRLFTFYNALGVPDSTIPNYKRKVKRIRHILHMWEGIFSRLPGPVSFSVRVLFMKQVAEARNMLGDLARKIPTPKTTQKKRME
ncbi:hypothetical protein JCM33374_g3210 [Metschnikowia sp. JCM 33374]|nr:hypothetical protein JCM33374_g3210 [Metschnikowia sp. JCM 33374]